MTKRKNVLLIVVDQWRGDVLSRLGVDALRTPNVDLLCREGVTFANHFTQAVPCGPARASLLTGMYQMNHRAVQNTVPLDARHKNLAHALRHAGYHPALIGYTTTTPDPRTTSPNDPRFLTLGDLMDGFQSVGAFEPNMDGYFGWLAHQGFELPENRDDIWLPLDGSAPGATRQPARVPAELSDSAFFTEKALSYLKGRGKKPWFLHLGYYRPHPPFIAPAPYHDMYDPADMPAPVRAASPEAEASQHPLLRFYVEGIEQGGFYRGGSGRAADLSEDEIRLTRAAYYGMLTEIDDQLGRVFAYLKESGQWDDTLIVFTSDHGEQLGDHHLLGKVGYFDESFHIPLIVRDPAAAADATRGSLSNHFTGSIDTMPTILDWLGADIPRTVDGRSVLPFCHDQQPADWRTEIQYEYDFRDIFYSKAASTIGLGMDESSLAVVQDESYKYVHFAALPPLFFDLAKDSDQFVNRAEDPAYSDLVRLYAQKMLDWRLRYAERTLTHFRSTPQGLEEHPRAPAPAQVPIPLKGAAE